MAIVPTRIPEYINWATLHAAQWKNNAAALGIATGDAAQYEADIVKLAGQYAAQLEAEANFRAAVETTRQLITDTRRETADLIRTIRGTAANSDDPTAVYTLALIPTPAAPSPVPPPAQPSDVKVGIDIDSGAMVLSWKASNPSNGAGTSYIVKRKLAGESAFTFVGVTGLKTFTDDTLPAGTDSVSYQINGQRGNVSGPTRAVTVNVGVDNSGQMAVRSVKMAA